MLYIFIYFLYMRKGIFMYIWIYESDVQDMSYCKTLYICSSFISLIAKFSSLIFANLKMGNFF